MPIIKKELMGGEPMLLHRRRQHMSQTQMAERLGISRATYCRHEASPGWVFQVPIPVNHKDVKDHEWCYLWRNRIPAEQVTQQAIADDLGCSRFWVNKMEAGRADCSKLIDYWESH